MMAIPELISCILGPKLFRLYRTVHQPGHNYQASALEGISDNFIKLVRITWSVGIYTSPIILSYLYRKGYMVMGSINDYMYFLRFAGTITIAFFAAYLLRGIGRYTNGDYLIFLRSYQNINKSKEDLKEHKKLFDYDFQRWPNDFNSLDSELHDPKKTPQPLKKLTHLTTFDKIKKVPCDLISYIAVYTFGRRLMYPGSVSLLQKALEPMLLEGRTKLIERNHAERFKLETLDGNEIDSIFVDNRGSNKTNGQICVICCEGNAGFYEIGTPATPIDAGYSVLGWNHPGFGGSTGTPFPDQEVNAIDTVVKFARHLGFSSENIIVFAWSIGGYPATWAAMQYPDIKGLILDASFDDVLPLAMAKMPSSWRPLVANTVRGYFNLNNSENLKYYNGPILFIRRTRDEIINTNDADPLGTNRANDLLMKLFMDRFPELMSDKDTVTALREWLSVDNQKQKSIMNRYSVAEDICLTILTSYIEVNGSGYPVNIGDTLNSDQKIQLLIYLASKHIIDLESTHCTPLPANLFIEPWDLFKIVSQRSSKL